MISGGVIYILWRPTSLNMFSWFSALGIEQYVANMRSLASFLSVSLPDWVRFSLPQALWLFSGCLAVHSIWKNFYSKQEQFWMAAVLILALSGELGQVMGIIDGVFDVLDLMLLLVAFLTAQVIGFLNNN